MRKRWLRPANEVLDNSKDLSLQCLDMDMISEGTVPVIRAFGVNAAGNSATVFIHGFTPYCYFALPPGSTFENTDENSTKIRMYLNQRLEGAARGGKLHEYCLGVQYVTEYKSIMGYESPHTHFFRVMVSMPTLIAPLKRIMEDHGGVNLPGVDAPQGTEYAAFECNVPYVLRYMIDNDISGAGWLTLPKTKYQVRETSEMKTHCQVEVDISYVDIISRKPEGEWSKVAPLRTLSFDIECQGRKGYFPEAELDPVIQIANAVTVYGDKQPIVQNVFTLKGCLPIVGAQVIPSNTEVDMLMKWRAFVEACDPDVITGYNVQNFDIPYLLDRAETLGKGKHGNQMVKEFAQWGRIQNSKAKMRDTTFQSAAFGKRNNIETQIEGRVIFDMLPYMQRNHKLSSYTLNSVCAEYLGQQKEDVHHSIISDLQNGTDEDRHRLATYCLKDAVLPQRLMDKLSVMVNYVEMARVTGVPMSFLISRGQQIKVFSMILRKCQNENLLVPTLRKGGFDDSTYDGATVLDPIKSYYQVPIATLDFASLYPSIMQAYNLCFSTLVSPNDVGKLDPKLYAKSENGHVFVHASVKKGILPTILSELLTARKRAKKDMKNAATEFERSVQNGRQLALKISANSVYGFTGATVGQLPCVPIASSTTSYGRQLLEKTKEFVETNYTVANGYQYDAQVVYGDTDSVMVKFGNKTVEETFPLAIEAAERCSKIFPNPILLEFEKVYFPYLLMNKKRYAGIMWTRPDKYDKMDAKGLETVRRDNCALVREVIQTSLDKILIDQDVQGAIDYVKSQISDLLQNKMDISRLVITKSLNKGADYALGLGGKKEDYKMKQAHVELAARMQKRDAGTAPQMGDRVPYVIITGAKGAKTYERGEDPIYVLENSLALDCKWYLTNQLSKPLTRIFEPIIDDVEKSLLQGEHTRKIFIPTPIARKGSLMMFAVKTAKCLGCRAPVSSQDGHLCKHCVPKEAEIYLGKLECLREAEKSYAELWSAAQRIHNTYHSDIMCRGDGCACQFYRRKKVQADIRLAQEVLDKFGR
ncbi:DNA polymerase delta catalytic subunit [Fragilariopsis cylindrus CCMP1102]|uniref:DNA polymerase n=1 Tax=Fragilariopsis cylindrus CCMP1102 TaxID=635003 RepID=A0A1E7FQS1_9STRA|nr:DNA polymerase delta catalytic subunit [Fragilariopsis cylindrus CCMP1102]|eukprot:OEU20464.1 DNA polymerase delta catalytic subunit [Fragilariopsis cylindrus CCMP1102]